MAEFQCSFGPRYGPTVTTYTDDTGRKVTTCSECGRIADPGFVHLDWHLRRSN